MLCEPSPGQPNDPAMMGEQIMTLCMLRGYYGQNTKRKKLNGRNSPWRDEFVVFAPLPFSHHNLSSNKTDIFAFVSFVAFRWYIIFMASLRGDEEEDGEDATRRAFFFGPARRVPCLAITSCDRGADTTEVWPYGAQFALSNSL